MKFFGFTLVSILATNFFTQVSVLAQAALPPDWSSWVGVFSNLGAGGASLLMAFWFLGYLKTIQSSRIEEVKQLQTDRMSDFVEYQKSIDKFSQGFKEELRRITEQFQNQISTLSNQWILSNQDTIKAINLIEKTIIATQMSVDNLQKAVLWLSEHGTINTPGIISK